MTHIAEQHDEVSRPAWEFVVERFEAAWQSGQRPQIADYLLLLSKKAPPEERTQLLIELVHADLEIRLKAGETVRCEEFFSAWPELLLDPAVAIELIQSEYNLRRQFDRTLTPEEFQGRFPQFAARLVPSLFDQPTLCPGGTVVPGFNGVDFSSSFNGLDATSDHRTQTQENNNSTSQSSREITPMTDAAMEPLPKSIGRYCVLDLLGSGAFGTVFKARDPELDREVAIKVPRRELLARGMDPELYVAEAKNVALLDHPGIVPVYDIGRMDDGLCYFVSKYISGGSLAQHLSEGRIPPLRAVRIVAETAEALHHAHRRGLVHRDIKPANIILDEHDRPLVADFGLALRDAEFGKNPGLVGTFIYMSPEQARGDAHLVDARSDIYSLGILLYELLTGKRPYRSNTREELLAEIVNLEPRPPRQLDDSVPEELDRICLNALSKRPSDRYSTAQDMAKDLRRWLALQEPTVSAPIGLVPQVRSVGRWLIAGVVLIGLVFGITRFWGSSQPSSNVSSPVTPAPAKIAESRLDVLAWDPKNPARRGVSLRERGSLPLKNGDQIRIEVQLEKPAYAYLIWIDSTGVATPVYPWSPGHWDQRQDKPLPVERLSLPPVADQGWPMRGASGMETVMLLTRNEPLPADVDLARMLAGLPAQPSQNMQSLVWFANGEAIRAAEDPSRAPDFFDSQQIEDPVLRTQRLIQERLGRYFSAIRAVSFAHHGD